MRKLLLLALGLVLLSAPGPTPAQVHVQLRMGFPAVLPPLVVVQPGVRVVQDFDEEVFFIRGYYWVQREGNWYRARDHRGTWRYVRPGRLPNALVGHQPGQYRRWQHDERRSWPEEQRAKRGTRHWRTREYQERRPPEASPPGGGRDRREGDGRDRRDGRDDGKDRRDGDGRDRH